MAEGASPSLPNPPFYTVANVNNFRDAAFSLKTSSGARIRKDILFRSAEVAKLDLDGWKAVRDIGVGHVFDLRSKPEVDKGWAGIVGKDANATEDDVRPGWIQAMDEAGVKRTWTPVFAESDYSPERLAERYAKYMDQAVTGFVEAYRDILRNGGPAFGQILRYLASLPLGGEGEGEAERGKGKGPSVGALVHCTAGKDRTGIFFGLLFDFLGVPRDDIASEYQLTELGLHHVRDIVVARLMQSPAFRKYVASEMAGKSLSREEVARIVQGGEEGGAQDAQLDNMSPEMLEKGRQAALRMVGAKRESMLRSLDMLDEEFGGAERYMREKCGMSDVQLDSLRRNLVVEA